MGVQVRVDGLTKSFGPQVVWQDVSLTLPPGEISVLLGPSGTGKSVFLKSLVGLLRPDRGRIVVHGIDLVSCSERRLYQLRRLYGVLFQDGALFGSMTLFDNIAFPLREHTKRSEKEIGEVVRSTMELVGLAGEEKKLPGEISGGMRKRAGLARALVLEPEIILFDEPDSGLDPVRVAYLNQLIVDLNAQTDATFLIVTHDIGTARSVPDNLGLLFRRELVMFGPRELLLTSDEPVVEQFLNGRREGPIGMAEEKDAAQVQAELAGLEARSGSDAGGPEPVGARASGAGVPPQLAPSPGVPERRAVARRLERVRAMLPTLPPAAQAAVRASLDRDVAAGAGPAERKGPPGGRPPGGAGAAIVSGERGGGPRTAGAAGPERGDAGGLATGQGGPAAPSPAGSSRAAPAPTEPPRAAPPRGVPVPGWPVSGEPSHGAPVPGAPVSDAPSPGEPSPSAPVSGEPVPGRRGDCQPGPEAG